MTTESKATEEAKEFVTQRQAAYRLTFEENQPANVDVLIDLGRFCRANESTAAFDRRGAYDTHNSARLDGRREVFLRIMQHLGLTADQAFELYSGRSWRK